MSLLAAIRIYDQAEPVALKPYCCRFYSWLKQFGPSMLVTYRVYGIVTRYPRRLESAVTCYFGRKFASNSGHGTK